MNRLEKYLADKRMSLSEFGRKAGVHRSTVQRWVKGDRVPGYEGLVRISAVTGIGVDALAKGFLK